MNRRIFQFLVLALVGFWLMATPAAAQGTEFTYQGRLLSGDEPANGSHDFEFILWDAETGGNQIGTTVTLTSVNVQNGVFSVRIDFGNQFPGANRFLEIKVRQSGSGAAFTTLSPRQAISSAPYAIKSINAENAANATLLGGFSRTEFVRITDSRLTDARTPLPNSPSYIQNTTVPQAISNFNITGNGVVGGSLTADALNGNGFGVTGLNAGNITFGTLNSLRLPVVPVSRGGTGLASPGAAGSFLRSNGSAWVGALLTASDIPAGNASYIQNSASPQAGSQFNVSGNGTVGGTLSGNILSASTQFNIGANRILSGGVDNLFAGVDAGSSNTGSNNAFFGFEAGKSNTSGFNNSFLGDSAGQFTTTGDNNTFVGSDTGRGNTTGSNNTFVGRDAGVINTTGSYNTAIGYNARFLNNNYLYATAIGAEARADGPDMVVIGKAAGIYNGVERPADFVRIRGTLSIINLPETGANNLCLASNNITLAKCVSSIRYKENINSYSPGLSLIKRLRPVSFNWKTDKTLDFGLVAEEVAEVEPLLITRNDRGEVQGVKYDRVGVVLVNAVNEQQLEIEAQRKQLAQQADIIRQQQVDLDALKKLVCSQNPKADLCQPKQ